MGRHKSKNGIYVPVGLQIRFEVMNRIYRNPEKSEKIPSVSELAARHHLSLSTVSLELRKLVKEGFLVGKHGSGTYTNPGNIQFAPSSVARKIIGLLIGDGRKLMYDAMDWLAMMQCGMAFSPDQAQPRVCSLASNTEEEICRELLSQNLDGLIWIHPPPGCNSIIRKLEKEMLPVIALNSEDPEGAAVSYSPFACGEKIGRLLAEEQRTSIVVIPVNNDLIIIQKLEGLKHYIRNSKHSAIEVHSFDFYHSAAEDLKCLFEKGNFPDAIYCNGPYIYGVLDLVKEYGIDIRSKCRLLAEEPYIVQRSDFHGCAIHIPFDAVRREIVRRMTLLWQNTQTKLSPCFISSELKFYP